MNVLELLEIEGISKEQIKKLASETGFSKRKAKKVDEVDFVKMILVESIKGSPSYNDMASRLNTLYGILPSKQAIWKRVNTECIAFFQAILLCLVTKKTNQLAGDISNAKKYFKRILVQDSTIIRLPSSLFSEFSGISNATTSVCNARIQGVYDLISGNFITFSIDSFSKNDLVAAPELEVQEGDLVLRDRGYWIINEMKRHQDQGADCIYRYKHKTIFLDIKTSKEIDLHKLLKKKKRIDINVCLNDIDRTIVRLVAEPVSNKISNKRRMDAKKAARKTEPSKELLGLMGWTIYITTVEKEKADFKTLLIIYGFRWRIEIIFKTWKSYLNFSKIHKISEKQLSVLLFARLIMIVVGTQYLFHLYCVRIHSKYERELSLMKFIKYMQKNVENLVELVLSRNADLKTDTNIDKVLLKYCTYDKRLRSNFIQQFIVIFS